MIVQATLAAIKKAVTDYSSFSNGESPWSAPEHFYTNRIAQKILSLHPRSAPYVTLEQNIGQAIENCEEYGLNPQGQYDIALWDGDSLMSVIEVKRSFQYGQGLGGEHQDVVRICNTLIAMAALGEENYFCDGLLALLVSGQNDVQGNPFGYLEERIEAIWNGVQGSVGHFEDLRVTRHIKRIPPDQAGHEYAAAVFRVGYNAL